MCGCVSSLSFPCMCVWLILMARRSLCVASNVLVTRVSVIYNSVVTFECIASMWISVLTQTLVSYVCTVGTQLSADKSIANWLLQVFLLSAPRQHL